MTEEQVYEIKDIVRQVIREELSLEHEWDYGYDGDDDELTIRLVLQGEVINRFSFKV